MNDILEMKRQIAELQAIVANLQSSALFPRGVETAIRERIPSITGSGITSAGNTSSYGSFPVIVPANPSGALITVYNGTTYNLLYK